MLEQVKSLINCLYPKSKITERREYQISQKIELMFDDLTDEEKEDAWDYEDGLRSGSISEDEAREEDAWEQKMEDLAEIARGK